jgi:HSP20 family protein
MSLSRYNPFFGFDDFFAPTPFARDRDFDLMPVLATLNRDNDMVLRRSSPGFEINEDDKQFQISMDLPGVHAEDINVELLNNGRVLHLTGGRKVVKEGSVTETKFEKAFTIGENVDTTKISANLDKGVLQLTAPKKEPEQAKHFKITVTENPVQQIEAKKD